MISRLANDDCAASLEASPCEVVCVEIATGRIVSANQRAIDKFGHPASSAESLRLGDVLCPDTLAKIDAFLHGPHAPPPRDAIMGRKKRHDGSVYDVSLSLKRLDAPEPRLLVVAIDISKQRHAERQEHLARSTLEASIAALPHGFVLYDRDDRLVLCNEPYKELYPRSAAAMHPGATFESILRYGLDNGEYREAVGREEAWLKERLTRHRIADVPVFQTTAEGRNLQIIERATPDGGRVGLRIDITDYVQSRERAERAEQRLLDAIRALPAGFWLFDKEDRLVLYNERFREMYFTSSEAFETGRTYEDILRAGLEAGQIPDALGREEAWLAEVLKERKNGSYEMTYQLDNGRWVHSLNEVTSEGGRVGFRVDITELKTRQIELEQAATTDSLTGLLNRRGAQQALERMQTELHAFERIAFLHVDLDRFKPVNDVFGHQFGDALLERIAQILSTSVRETDVVARIGGDEFLVCHITDQDAHSALDLAQRLRLAISEPHDIHGQSCHIGASIGVASYSPHDEYDILEALQDADIALNGSKSMGRNMVMEFEPSMREQSVADAQIVEDVVRGLDAGEFLAYFQPVFDAQTLEVGGFECLARWNHPTRGVLSPGAFLAACDSAGVVGAIDRAVLDEAVGFAADLKARGREALRISLNLSSAQLKHPSVVDQYLWLLESKGLEPNQFRIEILESTLLEDRASHVAENIRRFRKEGFLIDLDDFGTGHTAIASLRHFPVDRIKIDRSLVQNIHKDAELAILTDAIVSLGRRLGLHVLAEGIECAEEHAVLTEIGCTCVQGYRFAYPMAAATCLDWLSRVAKDSEPSARIG